MVVVMIVVRLSGGALLATGGWRLGEYISDTWGPELYVPWVFGLAIAGAALGLLGTPYVGSRLANVLTSQAEGIPTSRLLSGIVGLVLGLLVALLFLIPLARIPGWLGFGLPVALSGFLAYLGWLLMLSPKRDLFQRILPTDIPLNGYSPPRQRILVDTSAIIDGRIADISHTGFVLGHLVVPSFILDELHHIADSSDSLRRNRGRRGLEVLNKLRKEAEIPIEVMDVGYDGEREVDGRLIVLAKSLNASIITSDFNLNRVAQIQGVSVLNINELANSLKPALIPGEGTTVKVVQDGKEQGQGVGYMDDGTMIVVEGGRDYKGQDIEIVITRLLQTAAGSIVFAKPRRD